MISRYKDGLYTFVVIEIKRIFTKYIIKALRNYLYTYSVK